MRHKKHFWIPLVTVFVLAAVCSTAQAQFTATEIVSNFNGLNGGQGFVFDNQTLGNGYEQRLTTTSSNSNVDTSAYYSLIGGTNFFQTFGIQPGNSTVANSGTALLNYNAATGTTTNADGTALTFGAAYLYAKYSSGGLLVTDDRAYEFYVALNTLTGYYPSSNWSTNTFLLELRARESDMNFWTRSYDPGLMYSEIGNYSVFVVRITDWDDSSAQNVLYIAKSTGPTAPPWGDEPPLPGGVPEPTTLLLWTIGGLWLSGTSWFGHRNRIKLAFA